MLVLKLTLIAYIAIWLLAMIIAYGYGRVGRRLQKLERLAQVTEALPPLSIVITAHNQASSLRRHLPAILTQDYDRFEVIVVNTGSNDETQDVLERLELQYANLRHTFTPRSARDISLERLALTLGIRSATYDWVVLTHPDCEPATTQWLTRIGETIAQPRRGVQSRRLKEPDMVLGLTHYHYHRKSWFTHKVDFFRLWNDIANFNHVLTGHAAMRADGCNMAYRKEFFLEKGGFAAHQNLKTGTEELLVNHNSNARNTALLLAPSAVMIQDPMPARRLWKQQRVFYAETRRYQRHRWLYRAKQNLKMFMPWLLAFASLVVLLIPLLPFLSEYIPENILDELNLGSLLHFGDPSTILVASIIIVCLLLLIYVIVKISSFNRSAHQLGCSGFYLSFLPFEHRLPFWNLSAAITHRFTSKNEFRKKFV